MWAPLRCPRREYTTRVAPPANSVPVKSRRRLADGIHCSNGEPGCQMRTTAAVPSNIMIPVPRNSHRYSGKCERTTATECSSGGSCGGDVDDVTWTPGVLIQGD